jgi:hypothetical protein
MDLVDGVDAVVAGGGDGVSLDCILEVTFSGGSAPFRPRAELRAADMLAHSRIYSLLFLSAMLPIRTATPVTWRPIYS